MLNGNNRERKEVMKINLFERGLKIQGKKTVDFWPPGL